MAAFCKGEPEVWQRWERVTEQGQGNKIVKIVINGFYCAGIDHAAIIARGAVISALIELLSLRHKVRSDPPLPIQGQHSI